MNAPGPNRRMNGVYPIQLGATKQQTDDAIFERTISVREGWCGRSFPSSSSSSKRAESRHALIKHRLKQGRWSPTVAASEEEDANGLGRRRRATVVPRRSFIERADSCSDEPVCDGRCARVLSAVWVAKTQGLATFAPSSSTRARACSCSCSLQAGSLPPPASIEGEGGEEEERESD